MKIDWLRRHFDYTHGIPSKNTIARLFANLNTVEFQKSFNRWSSKLLENFQGVIPIDGKTLCNSLDENGSPIHIVSAFASHLNLMIAQEKVNSKSNEIKAIPELLDLFEVKGNIITIDAMGCPKEIAKRIIETRRCYVSDYIEWMQQKPEWAGFKTVILLEEERMIKGKVSKESRYFISSLSADAEKMGLTKSVYKIPLYERSPLT